MKSDDPSSPTKYGDISPINGSISSLADDSKPSPAPPKPPRKTEPSFERLPNFSRVTPAQLAHITFPSDGRYQPVRTVSSKPTPSPRSGKAAVTPPGAGIATTALGLASEKYAGGGGILILVDQHPEEEAEFIEFQTAVVMPTPEQGHDGIANGHALAGPPAASGPHIALDENAPEADPPESFEVSWIDASLTKKY
jgi:26S proteasome regulatory subunit N2